MISIQPQEPWTIHLQTDYRGTIPFDFFKALFLKYAVEHGKSIYDSQVRGFTASTSDICSFIENYPETQLLFLNEDSDMDNGVIYSIRRKEGLVLMTYSETHVNVSILSVSQEVVKQFS